MSTRVHPEHILQLLRRLPGENEMLDHQKPESQRRQNLHVV